MNMEYSVRRCIRSRKEFVSILHLKPQCRGLLSLAFSKVMNTIKFRTLMKNQFTKSQQEHLSCGLKRAKHLCCKHVINSKVSDGVYWDCQSSNKIVQVSFNPHLSQREYEAPRNFCSGYKAGIANNSKNWSCSRTFLETLALFPRRISW